MRLCVPGAKIVFMNTEQQQHQASALLSAEPSAAYLVGEPKAAEVLLGEKLRQAREALGKDMSRKAAAVALGVHDNTIAKFERGESVPDALQLVQLAQLYGRHLTWFLDVSPAPLVAREAVPEPAPEAVDLGAQVYVPHFDVRASAGYGAFNGGEAVRSMLAFEAGYIRHALGIGHNRLALINVSGASMEPMIGDGDLVLVDRVDTTVQVEGPHLVRMDGALLVKLLARRPGGKLRVSSVNEAYEPFEVDGRSADFEVLGRVRWGGVTFR